LFSTVTSDIFDPLGIVGFREEDPTSECFTTGDEDEVDIIGDTSTPYLDHEWGEEEDPDFDIFALAL
jgi:hypothetical protein